MSRKSLDQVWPLGNFDLITELFELLYLYPNLKDHHYTSPGSLQNHTLLVQVFMLLQSKLDQKTDSKKIVLGKGRGEERMFSVLVYDTTLCSHQQLPLLSVKMFTVRHDNSLGSQCHQLQIYHINGCHHNFHSRNPSMGALLNYVRMLPSHSFPSLYYTA